MLPAGMFTRRAASRREIVVAGVRWFRCDGYRKCVATAHPLQSNRHHNYHVSGTAVSAAAGDPNVHRNVRFPVRYCSSSSGSSGKKVVPFLLADIGEGISEVTVKEWYVNVGDRVAEFDDVCEVESDKATVTITSRYAGVVTERHYETGSLAPVGSALVDIEVDGEGEESAVNAAEAGADAEQPAQVAAAAEVAGGHHSGGDNTAGKVLTTPAVRRIAAEKGIDLTTIRGTGKHGRVLKEDVLEEPVRAEWPPPAAAPVRSSPPTSLPPDFIPLTGYYKTMRSTMEASNAIPTLVVSEEVNMTRLTELKAHLSPHMKLTLLPFLVKATSLALALHPRLNSTASPDFGAYRPNATHNIGVAIDTPLGLAVPNVKDVQTLTVVEVANRLLELRAKAEKGKLAPADVTGGTFTLSNMGSIAGSAFRPMILPPEVAIGALGRMQYRPRYDDQDRLVKTPVMGVSWAADHRILDGATVARFFKDWKTYVENPSLILAGIELKSEK